MKRLPDSIWRSCVTWIFSQHHWYSFFFTGWENQCLDLLGLKCEQATINTILMIRDLSDENQSHCSSAVCRACGHLPVSTVTLAAWTPSSREVMVFDHVLSFLWKQNEAQMWCETNELQLKDQYKSCCWVSSSFVPQTICWAFCSWFLFINGVIHKLRGRLTKQTFLAW